MTRASITLWTVRKRPFHAEPSTAQATASTVPKQQYCVRIYSTGWVLTVNGTIRSYEASQPCEGLWIPW